MAVEVDVKRAEALGKQQKIIFTEDMLKERKKSILDPINRQKLLTMVHTNKSVILSTSKRKVNEFVNTDY